LLGGGFHSHYNAEVDHHLLATISLVGTTLDLLGGLYLAYDLLGGQHGPLRVLTRMVTYSVIFGIFYGLGLGVLFGAVAGIASGVTIAFELNRAARGLPHYTLAGEALCSVVRSAAFTIGIYPYSGLRFALAFGTLSALGQIFAYSRGMRPSIDYHPGTRPRITRSQFLGTVNRIVGTTIAALLCSLLIHHINGPFLFALRVGVTTGAATGVGILSIPVVEFYADHLPERRLGVFGIGLILCGFSLQSVQYWLALLDVRMR
jgi:hypothetical protein